MTTEVVRPFDDPVGNWHRCPHCKECFFVASNETIAGKVEYCACCGKRVQLGKYTD